MQYVTTLGRHELVRATLGKHDVALMALNDDKTVSRLKGNWRFLTPQNLGVPHSIEQAFIVYGYLAPPSATPFSLPDGPVGIITTPFSGDVDSFADPHDREIDLLLDFPSRLVAFDTLASLDAPRISGMSGSSVWGVHGDTADNIWTPESQVRVVGIQSSAKQGSYIRAKRWHLLWSAFADIDKKAAAEIHSALERVPD